MKKQARTCPDCDGTTFSALNRRSFIKAVGAGAVAASAAGGIVPAFHAVARGQEQPAQPENLVRTLYESLRDDQRSVICFPWDHQDPNRGLLRTFISNNWHITEPTIGSDFYTSEQQEIIRAIFEGLYNPEWVARIDQQLRDDAGGYGLAQNIALFGAPGTGQFQFVMTGRHLTIRCDGDSAEHVAFGGPIFYGHAASGFDEDAAHTGNVFWEQGILANQLFEMLDGRQRELALLDRAPAEEAVGFRGPDGQFPGIPVSELTPDQREHAGRILAKLLEPYRNADQTEARTCLETMGGLEECSLAFYQSGDIGNDGVWDIWRLEGPSFVWHFRGSPHVHVWVNVADSHEVELNA